MVNVSCLFAASEVVLVVSVADCVHDAHGPWRAQLAAQATAIKALNKTVVAVVVNHMDRVQDPGALGVATAHVLAVMARAQLKGAEWSPATHHTCNAAFRARVFTLLLIRLRAPLHLRLPRDVLFIIVRELALLEAVLVPVVPFSCNAPRDGNADMARLLALLHSAAVRQVADELPLGDPQLPPLMSVLNAYKIGGVGQVVVGRVVQGVVTPTPGAAADMTLLGSRLVSVALGMHVCAA